MPSKKLVSQIPMNTNQNLFELNLHLAELEAKVLTYEKAIIEIVALNNLNLSFKLNDELAKQRFIARTKYKIIP